MYDAPCAIAARAGRVISRWKWTIQVPRLGCERTSARLYLRKTDPKKREANWSVIPMSRRNILFPPGVYVKNRRLRWGFKKGLTSMRAIETCLYKKKKSTTKPRNLSKSWRSLDESQETSFPEPPTKSSQETIYTRNKAVPQASWFIGRRFKYILLPWLPAAQRLAKIRAFKKDILLTNELFGVLA